MSGAARRRGQLAGATVCGGFHHQPGAQCGRGHAQRAAQSRAHRADTHRRAGKALALTAHHWCEALVLGAWGCGVFQNDPATVARAFADYLRPDGVSAGAFATYPLPSMTRRAHRIPLARLRRPSLAFPGVSRLSVWEPESPLRRLIVCSPRLSRGTPECAVEIEELCNASFFAIVSVILVVPTSEVAANSLDIICCW